MLITVEGSFLMGQTSKTKHRKEMVVIKATRGCQGKGDCSICREIIVKRTRELKFVKLPNYLK